MGNNLLANTTSYEQEDFVGWKMSTRQWSVAVYCNWEGNPRSGVALVMRHRLCGLSTYELSGLRKGDEHPAYTPLRSMVPFTFTCCNRMSATSLRVAPSVECLWGVVDWSGGVFPSGSRGSNVH